MAAYNSKRLKPQTVILKCPQLIYEDSFIRQQGLSEQYI